MEDTNLLSNDERTNQLLEIFKFGNEKRIFDGLNWDEIYNLELNEFDCWRLFNYFQNLWAGIDCSSKSEHMKYQVEVAGDFKKLMKSEMENIKMFILKDNTQKKFLEDLKAPKKIKEGLRLPFNKLFLDSDFKVNENIRIFGVLGLFYNKEGLNNLNNKAKNIVGKELPVPICNTFALRYLYAHKVNSNEVVFCFSGFRGAFCGRFIPLYFANKGSPLFCKNRDIFLHSLKVMFLVILGLNLVE